MIADSCWGGGHDNSMGGGGGYHTNKENIKRDALPVCVCVYSLLNSATAWETIDLHSTDSSDDRLYDRQGLQSELTHLETWDC